MQVLINNPLQATIVFGVIFLIIILISFRRRKESDGLSLEVTQELKGIATLMVVLSHIGYFLVNDSRFLFPLTVAAGVGVNLFLFLSGYGLSASSSKSKISVWKNYLRRLGKLFVPMWIILALFYFLDFFYLGKSYSLTYIIQSVLGFFPHADLYQDINSPLWYFTLIIFYYLIFPLVFWKKFPWLSAIVIYLISYFIIQSEPVFLNNVLHLHKIHLVAFPLGVIFAYLFSKQPVINFFKKLGEQKKIIWRCLIIASGLFLAIYTIKNSNVGVKNLEEWTSIISVLALIAVFAIKKIKIRAFYWLGFFSYEIYLLHWPIMYRYDFIYKYLPAWLGTILYLFIFILLGWGLNKLSALLTQKTKKIDTKKTE